MKYKTKPKPLYRWSRKNQIEGYRECKFDYLTMEDRKKAYYMNEKDKCCYLQYTFSLPCYLGYAEEKEENEKYIRKGIKSLLNAQIISDRDILIVDSQGKRLFLKYHWSGEILTPERVLEICSLLQDYLLKIKPNDSSR